MSNSQEASAILSELDQFAAGFTDLIKTPEGRKEAMLLHTKLGLLSQWPELFEDLDPKTQEIIVRMACAWLDERMMSAAAQRDQ